MFNFNLQTIIVETLIYIFVNFCIKFVLSYDEFTNFRRAIMFGYLIFASFFMSIGIFLTVSIFVIILAFGVRKFFDY